MIKKAFSLLVCLISGLYSFGQITQSAADMYTKQASERILNYYSALNLITGNKLENDEKSMVIFETINKMFESEQVYVTNDIDPTNSTQKDFKIKDCLENIRLFYNNSDVSFNIDSTKVSSIYKAKDFYFIKVEVFREMTVTFNNQPRKNLKHLDFYVKFVPGLFDCQIYSIKEHEDNLGEFTKARITVPISLTTPPFVPPGPVATEPKPNPTPPVIETVPKVDSLQVLKNLIKKQSHKQTFWGISAALMTGTGGYFLFEADQKYKEYQNNTTSRAASLRDTAELYDKIGPALLGVASLCAIEFTVHSIKKGKVKNNLRLYQTRHGLALSYNF